MTAPLTPVVLLADRTVDLASGWVARPCGPLRLGAGPLGLLRRLVAAGGTGLTGLGGNELLAVKVALQPTGDAPMALVEDGGTWRLRRGGGSRAARAARAAAAIDLARELAGTDDGAAATRLVDALLHPMVTPGAMLRGSLRAARVQLALTEDAPDLHALRAELRRAGLEARGLLPLLGRIALLEGVVALRGEDPDAAELAFARAQAIAAPRADVDGVVSALRWRQVVAQRRGDIMRAQALRAEARRALAQAGRAAAA